MNGTMTDEQSVSAAIFQALCQLWNACEDPMVAIEQWLQERCGVKAADKSTMVLYGVQAVRRPGKQIVPMHPQHREECVGMLEMLSPGVVLLNAWESSLFRPLSGVLGRLDAAEGSPRFSIRSFAGTWATLDIREITTAETAAAGQISWQIGSGHGEMYGELLVEPAQWQLLQRWLLAAFPV